MTKQIKHIGDTSSVGFRNHHQLVNDLGLPPARTLLQALMFFDIIGKEKTAIDLGCGAGADTLYLLNGGWQVHAIDKHLSALEDLKANSRSSSLSISQQNFEDLELPKASLINASFALPFCHPACFDHCWLQIMNALVPGGIFCGHFFGERDSWAIRKDMTFHSVTALAKLFKGFEIKWQQETEKDGKTLGGESKHWHVHHVVACKG